MVQGATTTMTMTTSTDPDRDAELLAAVTANPLDDEAREVYADWLEQRGDPRGEYLRLEHQLHRIPRRLAELAPNIDPKWIDAVANRFSVLLVRAGPNKIELIKNVRQLTGLGLKDAKDLVESVRPYKPAIVCERVTYQEAIQVAARLSSLNQVEVVPSGQPLPPPPPTPSLWLVNVVPTARVRVVKLVKDLTDYSLADAVALVDSASPQAPCPLPISRRRVTADLSELAGLFAGLATVEIR